MTEEGRKVRLAFFDRGDASYIRSDIELLEGQCHILRSSFEARKGWLLPWALLRQLVASCWYILRSEKVFVHFAGWNSLVPLLVARCFGRPSVLFLHGTDSVRLPSIGYGNFRKQPLALVSCWSLRLTHHIVAVDVALLRSVNTYATGARLPQGVLEHCPGLRTRTSVLPHGFDSERWPLGTAERDIDVLTVAVDLERSWRRQLKGVDLLIELARRMPGRRFVIIGLVPGALPLPANMIAVARVPSTELSTWYRRAKVYVQASMSEGFGCALAEAMLSGCIPVVSEVGAMPRIIGDTGTIVRERSTDALERAVHDALARCVQRGADEAARDQIRTHYPLEQRKRGLLALCS